MKKDNFLLERAYMSISKPIPGPEPTEVDDELQPFDDKEPSFGPDDMEPLDVVADTKPEIGAVVTTMTSSPSDDRLEVGDENQEDELAISNVKSIASDIARICDHLCVEGGHLEPWAQQSIAIAMDSIAEVARRCCGR